MVDFNEKRYGRKKEGRPRPISFSSKCSFLSLIWMPAPYLEEVFCNYFCYWGNCFGVLGMYRLRSQFILRNLIQQNACNFCFCQLKKQKNASLAGFLKLRCLKFWLKVLLPINSLVAINLHPKWPGNHSPNLLPFLRENFRNSDCYD